MSYEEEDTCVTKTSGNRKNRIAKCQKSPTVGAKETYEHTGILTRPRSHMYPPPHMTCILLLIDLSTLAY
jgi:hypothetical protein